MSSQIPKVCILGHPSAQVTTNEVLVRLAAGWQTYTSVGGMQQVRQERLIAGQEARLF